VKLGQPVPTLSGGEAQRLKLRGISPRRLVVSSTTTAGKLFLFDRADDRLISRTSPTAARIRKLLAAGHSLLVIEHNLDIIRASDWIIDLGPEGGDRGGKSSARHANGGRGSRSFVHGTALAAYEKALAEDVPAERP